MINSPRLMHAWAVLEQVADPEIPAISICDLGIVRDLIEVGETLEVVVTPTYSGCPATEQIEHDIYAALLAAELGPVQLRWQRAPAWTTAWLTATGKEKLRAYGIAPPTTLAEQPLHFIPPAKKIRSNNAATPINPPLPSSCLEETIACPLCSSTHTEKISSFSSTACKALYRCKDCLEPFEYFKPI